MGDGAPADFDARAAEIAGNVSNSRCGNLQEYLIVI
jgi:hypothetical protein